MVCCTLTNVGSILLSSEGLGRMLTMLVTACAAFGLTVSQEKTEIMCLQTQGVDKVSFTSNAAGQVYKQTIGFVYMGRATTADRDLSTEIWRRLQRAWACFQRYKMQTYYRPGVRLRWKVLLLEAEVTETLLFGCICYKQMYPTTCRSSRQTILQSSSPQILPAMFPDTYSSNLFTA